MQQSDIRWASRWDTYLLMTDDQIHWFSIINSLMIVLFLSGMVAMIMMRTLHRDISKYNQLETAEEAQEETGWKLVGALPIAACHPAVMHARLLCFTKALSDAVRQLCHVCCYGQARMPRRGMAERRWHDSLRVLSVLPVTAVPL